MPVLTPFLGAADVDHRAHDRPRKGHGAGCENLCGSKVHGSLLKMGDPSVTPLKHWATILIGAFSKVRA